MKHAILQPVIVRQRFLGFIKIFPITAAAIGARHAFGKVVEK